MRTIELEVMKFEELSDSAKENARDWFRQGNEYTWFSDAFKSIDTFCSEFNVRVKNYQIGTWRPSFIETDATNENFRRRTLLEFNREHNPTGYCLDLTIWQTFYDTWKKTGSAFIAFNEAIDEGVRDIVRDMEYLDSDESVDEMLIVNEYEFYPNGKIYH